jgi:hypothetical protein
MAGKASYKRRREKGGFLKSLPNQSSGTPFLEEGSI